MPKQKKKLEILRGLFFQAGIVIACGLTFVAFEWTTVRTLPIVCPFEKVAEADWDMPIVIPEEIVEKPKVKTEELITQPNPDEFELVDDKMDVKEKSEKTPEPLPFDDKEWEITEPEDTVDIPVPIPGVWPELEGGIGNYLKSNLKYPARSRNMGIEGKVYVQFVVSKRGKVKDVKLLGGLNKEMNAEAIRVIQAMPNWKPGTQHGKPVSVIFNLPIKFELQQ